MDNQAFAALKAAQVKNSPQFQAFQKLVSKEEQYKALLLSPHYRVLEEFLQECLSKLKDSLVTQYRNASGEDISDFTRGRILALQEILTLNIAISSYKEMLKQAAPPQKGEPKAEGPAL